MEREASALAGKVAKYWRVYGVADAPSDLAWAGLLVTFQIIVEFRLDIHSSGRGRSAIARPGLFR